MMVSRERMAKALGLDFEKVKEHSKLSNKELNEATLNHDKKK
jgi:hypothetical protein